MNEELESIMGQLGKGEHGEFTFIVTVTLAEIQSICKGVWYG